MQKVLHKKNWQLFQRLLTASSIDARHPCMDDKPYKRRSFPPSSENFSVLGVLRYIPIPN